MINLSSFIAHHAASGPQRTAFVYGDRTVGYREFARDIGHVAGWLSQELGIGSGDVVALLMKNSAAFLELTFAISHLGAILLPLNYRLSGKEIAYILDNAGAKLILADEEFESRLDDQPRRVVLDATAQRGLRSLVDGCPAAPARSVAGSDTFRLMYTSGTTDRPKGVIHSYDNFYWKSMAHVHTLGISRETRLLTVQPLYHVGAFDLPGMAVLWAGGMICLHRDFDTLAALASIERHRLTGGTMVPVLTGSILSHPDRHRYDVSSLRWIVGGGEKTPESRIRAFHDYFPNARYIDAYGLTESCSGDTFMEAGMEIEKIGSAGRATLHVKIEIRDGDGSSLPARQEGEICLRGPKIAKGYWNDPERTAAAFDGSWFRTGDVGFLDEDGFLYLTDRKKDMLKSGGENIASSEVERVLYELPQVREAAVIGVPDERWGERPVAFLVLAPDASVSDEELNAHCRASLAGFKVPQTFIRRSDLPRNATGKILKRQLRLEWHERQSQTN